MWARQRVISLALSVVVITASGLVCGCVWGMRMLMQQGTWEQECRSEGQEGECGSSECSDKFWYDLGIIIPSAHARMYVMHGHVCVCVCVRVCVCVCAQDAEVMHACGG